MTPAHPHPAQHHHHGDHHPDDDTVQAEILDLDADVLAQHLATVVAWLPVAAAPRLIVDLGCGTGTGTLALLHRFPEARVVAVDASPGHLRRVREKACAQGVDDRVRTVLADLDAADRPDLGTPDLVWAASSMHHLGHPDRALRRVRDVLAPGGLFAVVESAGLPRFLPEDAPEDRPGLEERCHAASDRVHAERLPHRGADWGPMLTAAGFALDGERTLTVDLEASRDGTVARYALAVLQRLRGAAAAALPAEDLAALDRLLDPDDPHGIAHRGDLSLRTERRVWAARPN